MFSSPGLPRGHEKLFIIMPGQTVALGKHQFRVSPLGVVATLLIGLDECESRFSSAVCYCGQDAMLQSDSSVKRTCIFIDISVVRSNKLKHLRTLSPH